MKQAELGSEDFSGREASLRHEAETADDAVEEAMERKTSKVPRIIFADISQMVASGAESELPRFKEEVEDHIPVIERLRRDDDILRILGPRDAERG